MLANSQGSNTSSYTSWISLSGCSEGGVKQIRAVKRGQKAERKREEESG
jgi:hypothetical protein